MQLKPNRQKVPASQHSVFPDHHLRRVMRLGATGHCYYYYYFLAHQHKAAGRKTRLGIQNYGCNGNLLCYHGVAFSALTLWLGGRKGIRPVKN